MSAELTLKEKLQKFKNAKESGRVPTEQTPTRSSASSDEPYNYDTPKSKEPARSLPKTTKTGDSGQSRKKTVISETQTGGASLATGNDKYGAEAGAYLSDPSMGEGMGVSFGALRKEMPEVTDPYYSNIVDPKTQGFVSTAKGGLGSKKQATRIGPLEDELLARLEPDFLQRYAPDTLKQRRTDLDTGYAELERLLQAKADLEERTNKFPTTELLRPFAGLLDFWYRGQPLTKAFDTPNKPKGVTAVDRALKLHEMKMKDKQSLTDDELAFIKTVLSNKQQNTMESSLEGIRKRLEGAGASQGGGENDLAQKRYAESLDKNDLAAAQQYMKEIKKDMPMVQSFEKLDKVLSGYSNTELPGFERGMKIPGRDLWGAGKRALGKESGTDRDYNDMRNAFESIKSLIRHSRYGSAQTVQEIQNLELELDDSYSKGPREFRNKVRQVSKDISDWERGQRSLLDQGALNKIDRKNLEQFDNLGKMTYGK